MSGEKRRLFLCSLLAAAVFLLIRFMAEAGIRSLGSLISALGGSLGLGETAEVLGRIFSQLKGAALSLPLLPPVLSALIIGGILWLGMRAGRASRMVPAVFGGVLLLVPAVLLTVWFTEVNGIRLDGMMLTLIRLIRAGALDSL